DLPHNVEAEQAVLAAILIEETAYDLVAPLLRSSDFYHLPHQHIYAACEELAKDTKPIDPVTVQQRLDARGLLGAAVQRDLPFALSGRIGTTGNVAHYAGIVADLARLRRMMLTAQQVVERGYDSGAQVRDFLEQAQQDVFTAAQGHETQGMQAAKDVII